MSYKYFELKLEITLMLVILIFFKPADSIKRKPSRCGFDNSPLTTVYEGNSTIETYPWLGRLTYGAVNSARYTSTTVVLVSVQIVLASAEDIDKIPKINFRERAKVFLGHNCSGPPIGILEYNYHPDYAKSTYSALALLQLDATTFNPATKLRPICAPPEQYTSLSFYAAVLSDDACSSEIRLHEMHYVDKSECKSYYRRSGLDVESMWPTHAACGRAKWGGECVWHSGAVLMMRQGNRWSLVGFGVHGPGCQAPSRFMDYGMYHNWVKTSVARIGYPAVTRIASNYVIMRRSARKLQRFGECDVAETKLELYSDFLEINTSKTDPMSDYSRPYYYRIARYNLTLYENIDYSCAVFHSESDLMVYEQLERKPVLRLRHWCRSEEIICYDFSNLMEMQFYVEVLYMKGMNLQLRVYGKQFKALDMVGVLNYYNSLLEPPLKLELPSLDEQLAFDERK